MNDDETDIWVEAATRSFAETRRLLDRLSELTKRSMLLERRLEAAIVRSKNAAEARRMAIERVMNWRNTRTR